MGRECSTQGKMRKACENLRFKILRELIPWEAKPKDDVKMALKKIGREVVG
jgi:hypothetical protein